MFVKPVAPVWWKWKLLTKDSGHLVHASLKLGGHLKWHRIYLAVNNTAPLFYGLVSPNGQEMLNGHIKKKRPFKTFSYKKLCQFDCIVYYMLFIKDFKPTQRDSNELWAMSYSYCMFLPHSIMRSENVETSKRLKIFLSMKSFNAIQAIFYSYLVTKRQNTIAMNITYITVN